MVGASRECILNPDQSIKLMDAFMSASDGNGNEAGDAPVGISSSNDELEPFPTLNQSGSPSPDM